VAQIGKLRERLAVDLEQLGFPVRTTPANFILVAGAPGLAKGLANKGMVVRSFEEGSAMSGWVRVTVRAAEENSRLVDAMRQWRLADDC
jgi:histidinol-phosphate/aromatic aminotransferase/cobyric acid decarboxylase-like protein